MSSPVIAVCIPTYNQSLYLRQAVESVLSQTYPNVEIWIADDCSSDDTENVAQNLVEQFQNIHYFRQKKNLGISKNNNWLLEQPQTDFIVRLDSDDLIAPKYLEVLVALLNKYPHAGYAHCNIQEIDENGNSRRVRRVGGRKEFQNGEDSLRASVSGYRVAANICMFRRKALQELHYYREHVEYCQDWDLAVRMADKNWGNVHCDQVLASYRVWTDSGLTRPRRKIVELEGNTQIYEEILTPAFQRRGWDLKQLTAYRQSSALLHATSLSSPIFSPQERQKLIQILRRLGNSHRLRIRIRLVRLGFGPFFLWQYRIQTHFRDLGKKLLAWLHCKSVTSA